MQIGIGLDPTLGLNWQQLSDLAQEAARLGYDSVWTNSNATSRDSFLLCARWWEATAQVVPGGLGTGISVVPAPSWTAATLASSAASVGELTGGRFILGIGTGSIYTPAFRQTYGVGEIPPLRLMREYLAAVRGLLRGESVNVDGGMVTLHHVRLTFKPPAVPVYLAALGPQMLRLAGAAADGASLNWCSAEQVAWSRERIAEGARRAGRSPAEIGVEEYIRVCVDEDEDVARRALAKATLGYALARPGASKAMGYRGHFGRMGFDEVLTDLEERRDRGAPEEELIEAFPRDLLLKVGYYGRPDGAAAAFKRLAEGLDIAVVRVVGARPGIESVRAVMEACAPKQ